jgi:outer membrane protein OmpA-like peptidoglycan-associated protein
MASDSGTTAAEAADTGAPSTATTGDTGAGGDSEADADRVDTPSGGNAASGADTPSAGDTTAETDTSAPDTSAPDAGATDASQSADAGTATGGDTQTAGAGDSGETATGETQTAKRTPASDALPGKLQLDFETGSAKLSDSTRATLKDLASTLNANSDARVQLMAYAKGGDDGASRARRLSLSRALAVRSFLIDQGVRSTRMDVRALGDTAKAGPLDRVDIVPANR